MALATLPVVTHGAGTDAWASGVLTMLVSMVLAALVAGLNARFPGQTVVEYSRILAGKFIGGLYSLWLLWMLLHISMTHIRIYIEIIVGVFLNNTPMLFLAGAMVLLSIVAVNHGVEVLGRMADAIIPIFLLFLTLSLVAAFSDFDADELRPVLQRGFSPILEGAFVPVALAAQYVSVMFLGAQVNEPEKLVRDTVIAAFLSGLTVALAGLVTVGVLGAAHAQHATFPFFKMMRAVEISPFLERMEVLAIVAWGAGIFVDVSAMLFSGAKGLSQLLGLKNQRHLLPPMGVVLALFAVFAFRDYSDVAGLFQPAVVFPYVMATIFLPVLMLWGAYFVKKFRGTLPGGTGGRNDG